MKKKNNLFAYCMTSPAVLFLLAVSVFPMLYTIINSFTDLYLLSKKDPNNVGLSNYITILKDPYFHQAVMNTVKFTVLGVIFETVLGLFLAVFVDSFKCGNKLIRTVLLLPMLVPPVTVALIWQTMFSNNYGIINEILGWFGVSPINWLMDVKTAFTAILVIDIWQYTPLAFLLIYASLQGVPKGQYEAASIDGANAWSKFRHITLPNISTGIQMVVLLRIIDSFRLFDKVNILTKGGPANSTATITQYIYQYGTKNFKVGYASAAAVIMTVIILALSGVYLYKTFQSNLKG